MTSRKLFADSSTGYQVNKIGSILWCLAYKFAVINYDDTGITYLDIIEVSLVSPDINPLTVAAAWINP